MSGPDHQMLDAMNFFLKRITETLNAAEMRDVHFVIILNRGSDPKSAVFGTDHLPQTTVPVMETVLAMIRTQIETGLDKKLEETAAMLEGKYEPRH